MAADTIPVRPLAVEEDLKSFYIGKDVEEVPKPAAVLDIRLVKKHCETLLKTVEALGVGFRAHVKSHKTTQIARMQVGSGSGPANFITSTVLEIEHLLPLFRELVKSGRAVNVLYGIPIMPSQVPRLARLATALGPDSITLMLDHPQQLRSVSELASLTGFPTSVFVKVDCGYHRAGLPPASLNKGGLLEELLSMETDGVAKLVGLYSHSSLSYSDSTPAQAMSHLIQEISACVDGLQRNRHLLPTNRKLLISVGATPQVLSSQNLLLEGRSSPEAEELRSLLRGGNVATANESNFGVELHAGVYCILDMQQIATNARYEHGNPESEIALSVAAEVCSVYNDGERSKPEALVAVGTLGLGREPCQSYLGWGLLSTAHFESSGAAPARLVVERISQEHSIVSWEQGSHSSAPTPLNPGQTVRIFPNHACVTGALYGWYLIVDSSQGALASNIIDVWVRATGW